MEIQLEPPFNNRWNKGYKVFDSSSGRYRVVFYNSKKDISGMSYARYLMSVHLGFEVPEGYEVDHINDDKTDDRIENLQVLTKEQNKLKQEYRYVFFEQVHYHVQCAYCGWQYLISERDIKMKQAKGLEYIFCSRSCAANHHHGKMCPTFMPSY